MVLRRYDDKQRRRRAHRFTSALRALAAGRPQDKAHVAEAETAPTLEESQVWQEQSQASVRPSDFVAGFLASLQPHKATDASGAAMASRRRRMIAGLGALSLVVLIGAVAGVVPSLIALVVIGATGAYATMLGRVVHRGLAAKAGSKANTRHSETERLRRSTLLAQDRASGHTASSSVRVLQDPDAWEPVETTLPTYVSKPKASKVPRVLDLTSPGKAWSGAAMVDAAHAQSVEEERTAQAAREAYAKQFEREMDAIVPDFDDEVAGLASGGRTSEDDDYYRYYGRAVNE